MADFSKIIEEVKKMTVMELNDLVKALEEEFGVSAAAPMVRAKQRLERLPLKKKDRI